MECQYCHRFAKSYNSNIQHELRCRQNPDHISLQYLSDPKLKKQGIIDATPCDFCGKKYITKSSLNNHKIRCPKNLNRRIQIMSDAGKEKSRLANQEKVKRLWSDNGFRERHRESMRRAVENNPESYTSSNRGRTKQIEYDMLKFQGNWELMFYKWAKSNNIKISKPLQGFTYSWNGNRTYFPDFFLDEYDLYIEIKGYETERDKAKWDQFPATLSVIKSKEIKMIEKHSFSIDTVLKNIHNNTLGL